MSYDPRDRENWDPGYESPEQYAEAKIDMLQLDMYINLTIDEVLHLKSLKTREDIDRAVHSIIDRAWG